MFDFPKIFADTLAASVPTPTPTSTEPLDVVAQALADHINVSFGCNRADVLKLVNLMRGEDLPPPSNDASSTRGSVPLIGTLVVFDNETVLVTRYDSDGDACFVTATLTNSNSDGNSYISEYSTWRYATPAECEAFQREVQS